LENTENIGFDKLSENLGIEQLWDCERLKQLKNKFSYFHWFNISASDKLIWNTDIIRKFKDDFIWEELAQNKSIPWSLEFCKNIRDIIPWKEFSEHFIFYSVLKKEMIAFLQEFKDEIDWNLLSSNTSISWSLIFENDYNTQKNAFELFINYWNPLRFSRNPNIWGFKDKIIKNLGSKLDWKLLSENSSFKWTDELLDTYKDSINWSAISRKPNYNVSWSVDLLKKFKDHLEWSSISQNKSIHFTLELVSEFEPYWENKTIRHYPTNGNYWNYLSENIGKKFDLELIKKYREKWHWDRLLLNENITWTSELIEQFASEILNICSRDYDGKNHMTDVLYKNKNIPFTIPVLDVLTEQWSICTFIGSTKRDGFYTTREWFEFSHNNFITIDIIVKYGKCLNVGAIINNRNLNWTLDLIKAVINIDIPPKTDKYNLGYDGDYLYMQDWIDKKVGFKINKINIIKELKKHQYVKDVLYEELLKSYIKS